MAVARRIPTVNVDGAGTTTPSRTGPYLEAYVMPLGADYGAYAEEGSMYIIQSTTPGTGIAGHAAPVQADLSTKPILHVFNGGTLNIIPRWIKCRITTAGAGGTNTNLETWLETGAGASSRASAGTLVSPAINCLGGSAAPSSGAVAYIGPVVSTLTSAKRTGHFQVRSTIEIVEDVYLVVYGAPNQSAFGPVVATLNNYCVPMAPVCVPPGSNFQFHHWGASHSGASSYDIQFCYTER
jgi:hypothetical protein